MFGVRRGSIGMVGPIANLLPMGHDESEQSVAGIDRASL